MAAAASSKPKAGKPVTTRHLAAALAEQHQLSKKQGLEMLEDLIGLITKHLKKGERVKIAGLGILLVRNRAARMPCCQASAIVLLWRRNSVDSSAPTTASRLRPAGTCQKSGETRRASLSLRRRSSLIEICVSGVRSNTPEIA